MIQNLNNIKFADAEQLKAYYYSLEYMERVQFVNDVMAELPQFKRSTFFNWKGMACRMPEEAKNVIEDVAGRTIFTNNL